MIHSAEGEYYTTNLSALLINYMLNFIYDINKVKVILFDILLKKKNIAK